MRMGGGVEPPSQPSPPSGYATDNVCAKLTMCDGSELSWVDEIRYLGVFVTRSRKFKCSIDNAKRSFHRAANGIFCKVGRLASEEVVVQLLLHKFMPMLWMCVH